MESTCRWRRSQITIKLKNSETIEFISPYLPNEFVREYKKYKKNLFSTFSSDYVFILFDKRDVIYIKAVYLKPND